MRKVHFEQGSPEWLNWRKGLLTATDAAALLGKSKYATPHLLWQRKTGQAPEQAVNSAMLRGQRDEPVARALFIKEYGIPMEPACVESDIPYIGASLDGLSPCGKYLLEIKSQRPVSEVPEMHWIQMQHQFISNDGRVEKGYYVSHWEGVNTTFEVYPDLEWKKDYLPKAKEFWEMIVFKEPPALIAGDYFDMTDQGSWNEHAYQYVTLSRRIKELEELKDSYRKELIKMCGDKNCAGKGIKILKKYSKGRIDYKEVVEVMNVNFDESHFRKAPTSTWTIMLDQN